MGLLAVLLALSAVVAGVLSGALGRAAFEEGSAARRALTVDGTAGAEIVTRRAADPAVQDETVRRIIGSCFGEVPVEVTRDVVADPAVIAGASEAEPFARWTIRPEPARITAEHLDPLARGATALRQQLRSSEVGVRGVQVLGDLEKTTTSAARNLAVARALSWIPSGLLAIVAALAVSRVTRLLAITRETETLQLLGRGATGGQVLFANLVEAGVVALTGSLAGSGLAWAVLAFFGGAPVAPVLAGGAATLVLVLGCVALAGIGRLRGPGRDETSRLRAGRLRTAVAATSLVLIAGGAGLASAQLLRVGSTIRWDRERPVPDWLATAAPALLLLLAALVAVALLGPLARLAEVVLLRGRGLTGALAAAQVARNLGAFAVAAVATVLAVGTTLLAAGYDGTAPPLQQRLRNLTAGAPVVADLREADAEVGRSTSRPSTPVWRYPEASIGPVALTAIAADIPGLAAVSGQNLPEGLGTQLPGQRLPVAITPRLAEETGLAVGDEFQIQLFSRYLLAVVAANVEAVPGTTRSNALLADAGSLRRALESRGAELPAPSQLWLSPAGEDPREVADRLRGMPGISAVTVTPTEAAPDDPSRLAASRFRSAALGSVVLAVLGIGAVAFTQAGMRRGQVAVLHALGADAGSQVRGRVLELLGVVVFAAAFGAGASWLLCRALMAGLASGVVAPGTVSLPVEPRIEPAWPGALLAVFAFLIAATTWALGRVIRGQIRDGHLREETP